MITIVDYGCGNIKAFLNAFTRLNIPVKVATKAADLHEATKIILPGVGAFDFVMQSFNRSGMRESVEEKILHQNVPVLGICAGMQIFADSSEEGSEKGLSWIPGKVKLFDGSKIPYITKTPHMGWNEIDPNDPLLFHEIESRARYYFVHSYYFEPEKEAHSIATTTYGINFSSAVRNKNIFGVQFHPEKSHSNGLQLLKNFSEI